VLAQRAVADSPRWTRARWENARPLLLTQGRGESHRARVSCPTEDGPSWGQIRGRESFPDRTPAHRIERQESSLTFRRSHAKVFRGNGFGLPTPHQDHFPARGWGSERTSPEERGPVEGPLRRKAGTDRVCEGIPEGFRSAEPERVAPGGAGAEEPQPRAITLHIKYTHSQSRSRDFDSRAFP
jgi:hypothetical protein